MEEALENGKESSHSAHANRMNECLDTSFIPQSNVLFHTKVNCTKNTW